MGHCASDRGSDSESFARTGSESQAQARAAVAGLPVPVPLRRLQVTQAAPGGRGPAAAGSPAAAGIT